MDLGEMLSARELWVEELDVYGSKTEITKEHIEQLDTLISEMREALKLPAAISRKADKFVEDLEND